MASYKDSDVDSAVGTLSIRDKTLLKRAINKHHNNNTSAGYVPVHEDALHRTGLRGRKTYAFWTLIGLLSVLAWGNMILTVVIFQVLRIGHGLESLEVIPEQSLVKFFGLSDLGKVYKPDGVIEGFAEEPIVIYGERGTLAFEVDNTNGRAQEVIKMLQNGTSVEGVNWLEVNATSTRNIFSSRSPVFNLPTGAHNAEAKHFTAGRLTSGVDEKLVVKSDSFVKLKGAEGTRIEGKEIVWSADQMLTLHSENQSITLDGGVKINVETIPVVGENSAKSSLPLAAQYKICVCMPQGKLFRVPISTDHSSQRACHDIDHSYVNSPCF